MTPKVKKTIIWSASTLVLTTAGFWIYRQVKKMMDYTLTFSKINVNKVSTTTLDFNTFFKYKNNSDIDIKLAQQEYDVFINGTYITTLKNYAENILKANSTSEIGFNTSIYLPDLDKKLKTNYVKLLIAPAQVKIDVVMKWKVRFGILRLPISYTWSTTLKEILGWYLPVYRK